MRVEPLTSHPFPAVPAAIEAMPLQRLEGMSFAVGRLSEQLWRYLETSLGATPYEGGSSSCPVHLRKRAGPAC